MKLWRNLIIMVVAVAVLIGAFFLIQKLSESNNPIDDDVTDTPEEEIVIFDFKQDAIKSIAASANDYTLEYAPVAKEIWNMTNSLGITFTDTDAEAVNATANEFMKIAAIGEIEKAPSDLKQYGLDNPVAKLVYSLKDGSTRTFEIGLASPTLGYVFALDKESNIVYTVNDYEIAAITRDLYEFEVVRSYQFTIDNISHFLLTRDGEEKIEFINDESSIDGKYADKFTILQMISPYYYYDTNIENIKTMLYTPISGLSFSKSNMVRSIDYAKYGLDAAEAHFEVEYTIPSEIEGDKPRIEKHSVSVSKAIDGKRYAKFDDYEKIYEFNAQQFDFLNTINPYHLITKVGFITFINVIDNVNIVAGDKNYVMEFKHTPGETEEDDEIIDVTINGKESEIESAKSAYQSIIALPFEGIYGLETEPTTPTECAVTINTLDGKSKKLEFKSLNDREYSYTKNGITEFIIKKATVNKMLEVMAGFEKDPFAEIED